MGLDVSIMATVHTEVYERNITHNLTPMAKACGLYYPLWRPEEKGWSKCKDIIPHIRKGLKELRSKPEEYSKMNATNGWGTYDHLIDFATEYLENCTLFPEGDIWVSR